MPTIIVVIIKLAWHFTLVHNDRGYGHGRFAGVFAVAQRQSELTVSEANAGAKPANCTSTSQWT